MKIKMHKHIRGVLGAMLFILVVSLSNCQHEPAVAVLENQPTLPAQANFEEKIWTNEDFSAAEIDPLDVNYNVIGDYPPDAITDETLRLIRDHNRKQLQRLTAGATK